MPYLKVVRLGRRVVRRLGLFALGCLAALGAGEAVMMVATMLLSLAIYAVAFGWRFAVGFVLLLLIHELGHIAAARIVGLRSSSPVFLPFLGAVINLSQSPTSAKMEANIAIGGPAAGTLSALVLLALYLWTDSLLVLVLAYTACLLNLMNLIPCPPLDGGKIAAAAAPRIWWLGSLVSGGLFLYTSNLFLLVIFVFSLLRLWRGEADGADGHYYQLGLRQRLKVALWYFGLVAVLAASTIYILHLLR